jgi:hypothetical protein
MGGGATIAAATAVGCRSTGIEHDPIYFAIAEKGIPALAQLRHVKASSRSVKGGIDLATSAGFGSIAHPELRIIR